MVPARPQAPQRGLVASILGVGAKEDYAIQARNLEAWAGSDPEKLAIASELVLALGRKPFQSREGYALMAARLAWEGLKSSPARKGEAPSPRALAAYDNALTVFVAATARDVAQGTIPPVTTPEGAVQVEVKYPAAGIIRPGYFDELLVAERIKIQGFRQRATVPGTGVALVGVRRPKAGREVEMDDHPQKGITMAVSAVANFSAGKEPRMTLEVLNPVRTETASVAGQPLPVAADFTAPLALSFGGVNDLLLGIRNLLNVSLGINDSGVYLAEPFDPDRIPVLLIHGLSSTPLVWRNVVSAAQADPKVRRNYQFWYAYYPTGAPVVFSAALIREDTERVRKQHDPRRSTIAGREIDIVGYSMGGNIARILATDIGDKLWNQIADVPFDHLRLDPDDREAVRAGIFWKPLPGVKNVIFVATPHRGARMADASFAQWANRLVRLPGDLLGLQSRFFSALSDEIQGHNALPRRVTGIDTLSPESPLFKAWEGVPLANGAKFYSIIGDRGRGDTPNSSDGIVGYWSSHLDGAQSELIVPTGHDAQAYPGTEQEIVRILRSQVPK
jgi:pimeloyl-ACP methyl ester carboxylesterase